jgi:hypothetical protein
LLPNRYDLWHDFKQSFVRDQNLTDHDLEFLKREISPANDGSPSDVQQLDAENPDNGHAQGFYDGGSDTNNSKTPIRTRAVSEGEGTPNSHRSHRSSNSEGSNGEVASQRVRQQLVCELSGQPIRGQEISGGPPPNSNSQPSNCFQVNELQEELTKITQQALNRYQEWSSQVEARTKTHESDTASVQHGDGQSTDPTSVQCKVLNQVEEYPHESSPGFPQAKVDVPGPSASPDNEDWYVLGESAILS